MEITLMRHNWEEFEKGNVTFLRALTDEEIKYYNCLGEGLVDLSIAETKKLAPAEKYLYSMAQWLSAAYTVVNWPQKMMLHWLSTMDECGRSLKG